VANGYLAVALGNLCENAQVRQKVRTRLGASGPSSGLPVLIRTVEEFILYHQNVDGILRKDADTSMAGDEGGDVWANHTERLQCVVRRLKGYSD
jgi:hypothetical protein